MIMLIAEHLSYRIPTCLVISKILNLSVTYRISMIYKARTLIFVAIIYLLSNVQVHQVRSMISRHNLEPDSETFRLMINLYVQMKDVSNSHLILEHLLQYSYFTCDAVCRSLWTDQ